MTNPHRDYPTPSETIAVLQQALDFRTKIIAGQTAALEEVSKVNAALQARMALAKAESARLRELLKTYKHRLDKRWREGTRVDAYARGYQDGLEEAEVIFDDVFQAELAKGK